MTVQRGTALRNAQANAFESTVVGQPLLRIYTGTMPANCAAARTGSILVTMTLPADWLTAASGGSASKNGTWSNTASGTGTAGYYSILDNDASVCHEQGTVSQSVEISTSASTANNAITLTFTDTTGVVVGMNVTAVGLTLAAGTTVRAVTATTVTLSHAVITGGLSGQAVTFSGDIAIQNVSINSGQTVTVSAYQFTVGNA